MGIFSFMKNLGLDVEGNLGETITKTLNDKLPGLISNLDVSVADGTVSISGEANSEEVREKAILIAGNVKGIDKVKDDELKVAAPVTAGGAPAAREPTFYTVKKGDTLSKIAKQHYGSADKWDELFNANQEVIEHPDRIYPGQTIRIPDLESSK